MIRRLVFFLSLTLALSPALRAQEEIPEVARSLLEEAEHAREAGRLDEAVAKYKRVLEVAPSLASAYVNLGAVYFKQGKIEDAYQTFVQGVEHVPGDRLLLSNAATAAQQLGKSSDALKYVDSALEANRRDPALFALRSTVLRSLGRNEEALEALQQAVQLSSDDAKLQFSLGNLLYQLGKREEAISAYRKAVELDRKYLRAYYNLGAVLFEAGRYDEALQAYRVALEPIEQAFARKEKVDPANARAYTNLGAIYLRQKQYEQAADAYQKALRLDPNDTGAHYNLGFVLYATGKFDRAEEEYRKALASDPTLPLAYLHLGEIAFKRGDTARAIQLLNEGMPRFDREAKLAALHTLGRAQLARGDRAGVHATYEEIAREVPDDPDAVIHLTYERLLAARESGDAAGERTAIETLLPRAPGDALQAEYVLVLLRQGDFDAARRELAKTNNASLATIRAVLDGRQASREVTPLAAAVIDALNGKREPAARALSQMPSAIARGDAGLLYWQLGRDNDARANLAVAHTAIPDWTEVTIALAETALAGRRFDDAIDLLSSAKCESAAAASVSGLTMAVTLGKSDDLCARQKRDLNTALLSQAAQELASGSPRRARQLIERAGNDAISLFLRGTADLASGDSAAARDELTRALNAGLPQQLESIARKNLEAAQPQADPPPQPTVEPSSQPRRTVVVFLPDAPAENDRKLAELIHEILAPSPIPLQVEFFRRVDDAREFLAANRDRVGLVIANPEFISGEFTPRFQFARDGRQTYHRLIVVPASSPLRNVNDLRGHTISVVDIFGEVGNGTVVRVPDDLTAIANVLYGKTDAALVSEVNPLLTQRSGDFRVIYTSPPQPLPMIAFAPMLEADRSALDAALRNTRSALGSLTMLERETKPAIEVKREVAYPSLSALGFRAAEPPASVALRVNVDLPRIDVPEPPLP